MKNHTRVSSVLNIVVITSALLAWLQIGDGKFSALSLASLLGAVAFSLMWVHYIADLLAPRQNNHTPSRSYFASRIVVMIGLILHPLIINWFLLSHSFGLPPESYIKLLGNGAWAVLLGWLAFACFMTFELRRKLLRFQRQIFHANVLAMFLILIHGFVVGMSLMAGWYKYFWLLLGLGFSLAMFYRYNQYYREDRSSFYAATASIAILSACFVGGYLMQFQSQSATPAKSSSVETTDSAVSSSTTSSASNSQSQSDGSITTPDLAASNGLNGAKCWVAIDGVAYDASNNREWSGGVHQPSGGLAKCGEDLSSIISQSPHGKSVLSELPIIGQLKS